MKNFVWLPYIAACLFCLHGLSAALSSPRFLSAEGHLPHSIRRRDKVELRSSNRAWLQRPDVVEKVAKLRHRTPDVEHVEHLKDEKFYDRVLNDVTFWVFVVILLAMVAWGIYMLCSLLISYNRAMNQVIEADARWTFADFMKYRFAWWFVWTPGAEAKALGLIFCVFVLIGGFMYVLFAGSHMSMAAWKIFCWVVAPNGGKNEKTVFGTALGAIISLAGLLLFALLLTMVQNSFTEYIEALREGRTAVLESGHVVLIGYTEQAIPFIQEMYLAQPSTDHLVVGILTNERKSLVEADIQAKCDLRGGRVRVVVRSGSMHDLHQLKKIGVPTCSAVVILPDRSKARELRDAFTMRILALMRAEGWPVNGRITSVCSLEKNLPVLQRMGGDDTSVVKLDTFLPKLMFECSQQLGLGRAVLQIFGFAGSEFYKVPLPKCLEGKEFAEARLHFPQAVVVGFCSQTSHDGGATLCPKKHKFKHDDEVVILAESELHLSPASEPCKEDMFVFDEELKVAKKEPVHIVERRVEVVMILGWSESVGFMLFEIDQNVLPGSTVLLMNSRPVQEREAYLAMTEKRMNRKYANFKVQHVQGVLGARYVLEDLPTPLEDASRIFVLADESAPNAEFADACTLATVEQIRDILFRREHQISIQIVPEILDPASDKYCQAVRMEDYVDSSTLQAQVLAMTTYQSWVAKVLEDIVHPDTDIAIRLRSIQEYVEGEPPSELSFQQIYTLANHWGDVVLGWSKLGHWREGENLSNKQLDFCKALSAEESVYSSIYGDAMMRSDWELNPEDKTKLRPWDVSRDKLVVLSRVVVTMADMGVAMKAVHKLQLGLKHTTSPASSETIDV